MIGFKIVPESALVFCSQCFCFVCDDRVAQCREWGKHCMADDRVQYWRSSADEIRSRRIMKHGGRVSHTYARDQPILKRGTEANGTELVLVFGK